jgi:hypothetical protein
VTDCLKKANHRYGAGAHAPKSEPDRRGRQ